MGIGWRGVIAVMTVAIVVTVVCQSSAVQTDVKIKQPDRIRNQFDRVSIQTVTGFREADNRVVLPVLGKREESEARQDSIEEQLVRINSDRQAPFRNSGQSSRAIKSWPVPAGNYRITGYFDEKKEAGLHKGVDIAVPLGTPVLAAFPGRAVKGYDGEKVGLGRYVYIEHDNGMTTYYGHLSEWAQSADESVVCAGSVIGWSGNTGRSTGPHLHFEVRNAGEEYTNPLEIFAYSDVLSR